MAELDRQSGSKVGSHGGGLIRGTRTDRENYRIPSGICSKDDAGGASRFFYVAKASRADREPGNNHPTVKSAALMQWLIRLIARPGDTILDPFTGSGSTGKAAVLEGMSFIGIESDPAYFIIAEQRINAASSEVGQTFRMARPVRSAPGQQFLAFTEAI